MVNPKLNQDGRFQATARHVYAYWPFYAVRYAALVLTVLAIGLSFVGGWVTPIPFLFALLILLLQILLASLWQAHQLYDPDGWRPHHVLFDMGQIKEKDHFAFINLAGNQQAVELGRRLTTGQIVILDVYNPQLTASAALARVRARWRRPQPDPRIVWRNGRIDLLPIPDDSVAAVIMCEVLSEFWQEGDREILLGEVQRVLVPNGRLLFAERTRTRLNWLVMGIRTLSLRPADYWRNLLQQAGFAVRIDQNLGGHIHCFRVDKPVPIQARQLPLNLNE